MPLRLCELLDESQIQGACGTPPFHAGRDLGAELFVTARPRVRASSFLKPSRFATMAAQRLNTGARLILMVFEGMVGSDSVSREGVPKNRRKQAGVPTPVTAYPRPVPVPDPPGRPAE